MRKNCKIYWWIEKSIFQRVPGGCIHIQLFFYPECFAQFVLVKQFFNAFQRPCLCDFACLSHVHVLADACNDINYI